MRYLLLVLLLAGCGKASVDPELQPYLDSFQSDTNVQIATPVTLKFGDIRESAEDGLCENGLGIPVITIDKTAWAQADDTNRKLLVYHELGHCVLGRSHDDTINADGTHESIMFHSSQELHNEFQNNPAPYLKELTH